MPGYICHCCCVCIFIRIFTYSTNPMIYKKHIHPFPSLTDHLPKLIIYYIKIKITIAKAKDRHISLTLARQLKINYEIAANKTKKFEKILFFS